MLVEREIYFKVSILQKVLLDNLWIVFHCEKQTCTKFRIEQITRLEYLWSSSLRAYCIRLPLTTLYSYPRWLDCILLSLIHCIRYISSIMHSYSLATVGIFLFVLWSPMHNLYVLCTFSDVSMSLTIVSRYINLSHWSFCSGYSSVSAAELLQRSSY